MLILGESVVFVVPHLLREEWAVQDGVAAADDVLEAGGHPLHPVREVAQA